MTARPNALRIGLFTLAGLAILFAAIASVFGGRVFAQSDRAVLHFSGSIYGLQIGAPVVFRGVRLGSVVAIGLVNDPQTQRFEIPVTVELDRELLHNLHGPLPDNSAAPVLLALVRQGLSGQLATQSLLTGLLYVDLDIRPGAAVTQHTARAGAPVEIPTAATRLQTLQTQLEGIDVGRLAQDVSAIAASTRSFVASPELRSSLDDLAQTAAALRRISATLDQRARPLADGAQRTLAQAGQAAERVGDAASQAGAAAGRADALLTPGSPLLTRLQQAADELTRTATALRDSAGTDSAVMQNTERTLADVARAARAVRELADLLQQQPDALLRGRTAAP